MSDDGWDEEDIEEALAIEAEHTAAAREFSASLGAAGGNHHHGAAEKLGNVDEWSANELALAQRAMEEAEERAEREGNPLDAVAQERNGATCQDCGAMSVDNQVLSVLKEAVCPQCRINNPKFKMMTKTKAKEAMLVTDDDLRALGFIETSNPRRAGWSVMKLYLTKHVEEIAMKRWGSLNEIEKEKERRAVERVVKREKRARKIMEKSDKQETDSAFKRNIKQLRGDLGDESVAFEENDVPSLESRSDKKKGKRGSRDKVTSSAFVPKNDLYHEHEFGTKRKLSDAEDTFVKTCLTCGYEHIFEEL